jgi:hypothetical protein
LAGKVPNALGKEKSPNILKAKSYFFVPKRHSVKKPLSKIKKPKNLKIQFFYGKKTLSKIKNRKKLKKTKFFIV